jgi:hypothetical protein
MMEHGMIGMTARTCLNSRGRLNKQHSNQSFHERRPLPPGGIEQRVWYDPGFGTHWYDHIRGGGFGQALS